MASRYAQSLQKQNLDARQATARARSAPSASTAGGATKRPASSISQDSSAVAAKAHGGPGTARAESAPPPGDLRDRLAAYRANKAQLKQANNPSSFRSKPQVPTGRAQPMQRPVFPQRISTPERPIKRPAKAPVVPKQTTRTLSFTHDAASSGKSIKPATSSSAKTLVVPAATALSGDEEIELLQSLYLQLCFAEAKAADTFHRQEQSAEVTTWCFLSWYGGQMTDLSSPDANDRGLEAAAVQTPARSRYDASVGPRQARESGRRASAGSGTPTRQANGSFEEGADNFMQAMPFVQVATALAPLMESMRQMCAALETSLHCMPTPGITCNPRHVKRHLEQLGVEVDSLLDQLQANSIDAAVSAFVSPAGSTEYSFAWRLA